MAFFVTLTRLLRCQRSRPNLQWRLMPRPRVQSGSFARALSTMPFDQDPMDESYDPRLPERTSYRDIKHARCVPDTPSYFSREPNFTDFHVRISNLLTQYRHLPTVDPQDAPIVPWTRLPDLRSQSGEQVKPSYYAAVMRIVKRLNLIVPSLMPEEVRDTLNMLTRGIDPSLNRRRVSKIDKFGRAVGAGKRKESTARAFVVEGTGEVLVNDKTLEAAFARVFDRESAVWALTSTKRLDKYNVWALVSGGGQTGQSQALAQAIAKALIVHEPALKSALKKAGCITRDARAVERKKHGRVKARKMPTWVKR